VGDQEVESTWTDSSLNGEPAICPEDDCCVEVATVYTNTDVTVMDPPVFRMETCPWDIEKCIRIRSVVTHTTRTTSFTTYYQPLGVGCSPGTVCDDFNSSPSTTELPILIDEYSIVPCT